LFLTWRLFGSLTRSMVAVRSSGNPGRAFAETDRILDTAASGPVWLKDPRIASLVATALEQGEREYRLYERFAWVIMPNHVHVVMRPSRSLPAVMRWLKGSTARSALERTGQPFWQYESYDHCVRNADELNRVIRYTERNPVRAGLVREIEDWPWSSAGQKGPTYLWSRALACAHDKSLAVPNRMHSHAHSNPRRSHRARYIDRTWSRPDTEATWKRRSDRVYSRRPIARHI
jgi:putative transposase